MRAEYPNQLDYSGLAASKLHHARCLFIGPTASDPQQSSDIAFVRGVGDEAEDLKIAALMQVFGKLFQPAGWQRERQVAPAWVSKVLIKPRAFDMQSQCNATFPWQPRRHTPPHDTHHHTAHTHIPHTHPPQVWTHSGLKPGITIPLPHPPTPPDLPPPHPPTPTPPTHPPHPPSPSHPPSLPTHPPENRFGIGTRLGIQSLDQAQGHTFHSLANLGERLQTVMAQDLDVESKLAMLFGMGHEFL